jgi:hypothetical protein
MDNPAGLGKCVTYTFVKIWHKTLMHYTTATQPELLLPTNTNNMHPLFPKTIINVENQEQAPLLLFFFKCIHMAESTDLTIHRAFSLHFFSYLYIETKYHQNSCDLVVRYSTWVPKSKVHATAHLAYVPRLATLKVWHLCSSYILEPSLTVANWGTHTLET